MKKANVLVGSATAVALSIALQIAAQAGPAPVPKFDHEKCYGVAARGKNDCGEGAHSCVGQATHDRDKASFVLLPKGDCQKIAGGKTQTS